MRGHAIEFRLNAEDPRARLLARRRAPCTRFQPPLGPGVRVDTHAFEGYRCRPYYDSLLAKVIVWDADRDACLDRAPPRRW